MEFVTAVATADAGVGLIKSLFGLIPRDPLKRHQFRVVINALRDIYFTPKGTQQVLRVLAEGGQPTPEGLKDALTAFNDAESEVLGHVAQMEFEQLRAFSTLSIEHRLVLNQIADHKTNLRRDIQTCLNVPTQEQSEISPAQARELLDRITELNRSIEAIEHELLRETGQR